MPTLSRFRNKICIVSAESRAAFGIAKRIGQEGGKIVINSKNIFEATKVINEFKKKKIKVQGCNYNIEDESQNLIDFTAENFGAVDILIIDTIVFSLSRVDLSTEPTAYDILDGSIKIKLPLIKAATPWLIKSRYPTILFVFHTFEKAPKTQFRILKSKEEINSAKQLLYEVYFKEQGWVPLPNNPSKIKYETLPNGKKILEDKHSNRATWFGAFFNNRLVCCSRLCPRDDNNKLEMQLYQPYNAELNNLLNWPKNILETNRLAVDKEFRGGGIFWMKTVELMLKHCEEKESSIVTSWSSKAIEYVIDRIKFLTVPGISFKYENIDKYPVSVSFADFNKGEINLIRKNIEKIYGKNNDFWGKLAIKRYYEIKKSLKEIGELMGNEYGAKICVKGIASDIGNKFLYKSGEEGYEKVEQIEEFLDSKQILNGALSDESIREAGCFSPKL